MLISIGFAVVALLSILWVGWALVQKFWPSTTTSTVGKVVETVSDETQDGCAMVALRAMRFMDESEGHPEALAAWETLYKAIGGTATTTAATTSVAPTAASASPVAVSAAVTADNGGTEHITFS